MGRESSLVEKNDRVSEDRYGSPGLVDRLHHVRKRKQAYSGQRIDAETIERLLKEKKGRSAGG